MTPFAAMRLRRAVQAVDPYYGNVSSLLHGDGPNASTTFTDQKGKVWTPSGGAQISTAQSVFGGASMSFNGSNSVVSTPNSADFAMGTGAFTAELRWRPTSASVDSQLVTWSAPTVSVNNDWGWAIAHFGAALSGKVRGFVYVGTTQYAVDSTTALSAGTWYAIRFERVVDTLYLYINGTREAVTVMPTSANVNTGAGFTARLGYGHSGATRWANGFMDEVRITKGVGRSSGATSYVLDTSAFPDS